MDKNNLIKLDHKITYNDPYLHEQFKITDEKEKEDLHDVIYKYDLLSIFGLNDFLEEKILEKVETLYKLMIPISITTQYYDYDYYDLFFTTFIVKQSGGNYWL